jgi:hypothetical protein
MLVEMSTVKTILRSPQMEMRNTFLEIGGKAVLDVKWQRT